MFGGCWGSKKLKGGGQVILGPTMKFPITRESLQGYDLAKIQEERKEEEVQKRLGLILESVCKEFDASMNSNIREKKFVWRNIHQIRQFYTPGFNTQLDEFLPRFVEKLKETFVGCDIIIDPLKTYLIIDWS
jgi:hypothetical protein